MDIKNQIIGIANDLLIERGFNAFSYKHIADAIAIKTSSIHYHFPTKNDLGIAIIESHMQSLENTIKKCNNNTAVEKMSKLFFYYKRLAVEQKVCIIGAFTSDINTLDEDLRKKILQFGDMVVMWTTAILEEGHKERSFRSFDEPKIKAKVIMANLMAIVQIARIEKNTKSFDQMTKMMLDDIKINGRK